jgi:hypothetical protein
VEVLEAEVVVEVAEDLVVVGVAVAVVSLAHDFDTYFKRLVFSDKCHLFYMLVAGRFVCFQYSCICFIDSRLILA